MSEVLKVIFEVVIGVFLLIYYCIEGFVKAILPGSLFAKDVKGQRVLITGAGSGLGQLMAQQFADLGCIVVLWDVNEKGLKETLELCKQRDAKAYSYTLDLCNRDKVYEVADKVKREVGDIDILINNAGIVTGKNLLNCPDNLIVKTMDVNALCHFWTVKSFLPSMLSRNHGHIVTIASAAGFTGTSGLIDYCTSKFAAVGFDESLRNELFAMGKDGVKTTVVCPIYISTGMFTGAKTRFSALTPMLTPDYVVSKIVNAILTNQEMLIVPRSMYISYALKGLLPIKFALKLSKFVGGTSSMDQFQGHGKKD